MRRCDGSTFWCRIIGQVLDPDKPQAGSVWLMEDVTERQMADMDRIEAAAEQPDPGARAGGSHTQSRGGRSS